MSYIFIPRVPDATPHNQEVYIATYMCARGGTYRNALRSWQVDCLRNLKRDLSRPFPSDEQLMKWGLIEKPQK